MGGCRDPVEPERTERQGEDHHDERGGRPASGLSGAPETVAGEHRLILPALSLIERAEMRSTVQSGVLGRLPAAGVSSETTT